jgi:hypothetical protein
MDWASIAGAIVGIAGGVWGAIKQQRAKAAQAAQEAAEAAAKAALDELAEAAQAASARALDKARQHLGPATPAGALLDQAEVSLAGAILRGKENALTAMWARIAAATKKPAGPPPTPSPPGVPPT